MCCLLNVALCLLCLLPFALSAFIPIHVNQSSSVPSKSVIIQLFEWNWDSIARECVGFIGPAGYGFVQVNPALEHVQGSQWWTDYQPVSYTLTSKHGNRAQFKNMIDKCHSAGVKVIVDTIFNHMSGLESGVGVGGSSFTHYNYPGLYQYQDFHHCGLEPGDDIVNWDNPQEELFCELDNLADLATETEYVRSRLASYANDLLSLGVDGLRIDAAKDIPGKDIEQILLRLTNRPYVTQEYWYNFGGEIPVTDYYPNGEVQEFRYPPLLKDAFLGGDLSQLRDLERKGWVPGQQVNVFVADHDLERGSKHLALQLYSPSNAYVLATIFTLGHPYGRTTVMSSYSFSRDDDGPPNNGTGVCSTTGGQDGWLCQHRYVAVSGMVGFSNNVDDTTLSHWTSPQSNRIAFGRGSLGFVAINNADSPWSAAFSTSLPDGVYCDVIRETKNASGDCVSSITVWNGQLSVIVKPRDAIAIHTGAVTKTAGLTKVVLKESVETILGQNIFLVGNTSQLGNWDPSVSIALSSLHYPVWTAALSIASGSSIEYKFIRKADDGKVAWESGPNRRAQIGLGKDQILESSWK